MAIAVFSLLAILNELMGWKFPDFKIFFTSSFWNEGKIASETLRNLMLVLVAPVALWLAFKRTKTAEGQRKLLETGQNLDRYQKAVTMLESDKLSVREAGIFVLRELGASDSTNHYFPVQNILCSFVRDRSQDVLKDYISHGEFEVHGDNTDLPVCPTDIPEALKAFSDLRTTSNMEKERKMNWAPNLTGAYLHHFTNPNSEYLNLSYAILRNAYLVNSRLPKCNFSHADLIEVNGSKLTFNGSDFTEAHIVVSKFTDSSFNDCNFNGTEFINSDFTSCCMPKT